MTPKKPEAGPKGSAMIDQLQLFKAEQVARLVGGDQEAAMLVIKARSSQAHSHAWEWLINGALGAVWPLADPGQRGEMLVDEKALAFSEHVALQSNADDRLMQANAMRSFLHRDLESRQFHRAEIARWLDHCGIHSEYRFLTNAGTARKLTDQDELEVVRRSKGGESDSSLARAFNTSRTTIAKTKKKHQGAKPPKGKWHP